MKAQAADNVTRNYEAVVIMHPDTNEEDQKSLFRRNKEIIKKFAGEVNHLDTWGKRRLANPINKFSRGIYFHMTFTAEGKCIHELERTMRINDKVLRFAHMRLDDRTSLAKHVEGFKAGLADAVAREKEREAKFQQRKAQGSMGGGGGGRRFDRSEDEE